MSYLRSPVSVTGFPRIGEKRELKKILEEFWNGSIGFEQVEPAARMLRARHWSYQKDAGVDFISSNDFSLYDNMLDAVVMLGAVPERFGSITDKSEQYFAMARGTTDAVAMEMTKWFNTNYHYIVPELSATTRFSPDAGKIVREYNEAKALGVATKISVIGPITFLSLSKRVDGPGSCMDLLPGVLPSYRAILETIATLGEGIVVQFDEPVLVKDPDDATLRALVSAYSALTAVSPYLRLLLMTYFDSAAEAVRALRDVPLYAVGLDFVYGPENEAALPFLNGKKLFAGIVDGRNIWKNDYIRTLALLDRISSKITREDIVLSTSCSLLHVPYSLDGERSLDPEILSSMSFAREKLAELRDLSDLFGCSPDSGAILRKNADALCSRTSARDIRNTDTGNALDRVSSRVRKGSFDERNALQKKRLGLPQLPATTIGSFPQTSAIREQRKKFRNGVISRDEYGAVIRGYIDVCIEFQEEIGLDVLVHGEPERNDMVEYFGEMLSGFVFTGNGWVQSYGSRCVKPPVIFGDVWREEPMTVDTIRYAQSLTDKPVKGMLTGPVTILNWSFVRTDIPRSAVCDQIALCIRDEISDLQDAGIKIVQVDEAAFREGYPLRRDKAAVYELWAVDSFRLAVSSASPETQIHTHMCYSDFRGIIRALEAMDADVITIETSRSGGTLLDVFSEHGYANEIGPGVYDIHSPRVPFVREFEERIRHLLKIFPASRLWINPDCGLKTRGWAEVRASLSNMMTAVRTVRDGL